MRTKEGLFVTTFRALLDVYKPSEAGKAFMAWVGNMEDDQSQYIDTRHALILDGTNTAYPIRWAKSSKVSAGGSWVLACGKLSKTPEAVAGMQRSH